MDISSLLSLIPFHLIGFLLTIITAHLALKIGGYSGYARDWTLIAIGLIFLSVARGLFLLFDVHSLMTIYDLGTLFGSIGISFELVGMYFIAKRLKKMVGT